MRGDFFTIKVQAKIMATSNHRPQIPVVDDGTRRRFNLLPMNNTPKKPDPYLKDKLAEEYPQILRWMLDGLAVVVKKGIENTINNPPKGVKEATQNYLDAEDMGASFDELVSEVHVVRQVVLGFCWVRNVARVGDGCFNDTCK